MSYEQQPAPGGAGMGEDPNKTMGIVGLVLAILIPLVGLIVSHIAKKKSAEGGYPENTPAKIGFIIGLILTILWVLYIIIIIIIAIAAASSGM